MPAENQDLGYAWHRLYSTCYSGPKSQGDLSIVPHSLAARKVVGLGIQFGILMQAGIATGKQMSDERAITRQQAIHFAENQKGRIKPKWSAD